MGKPSEIEIRTWQMESDPDNAYMRTIGRGMLDKRSTDDSVEALVNIGHTLEALVAVVGRLADALESRAKTESIS